MLREQLQFHWRSHILPVLAMVFLFSLTFSSVAMVSYGERAVALSARMSTPPSDFLVYIEVGTAAEMSTALARNPNVDRVHVDAWRASEAISATGNVSMVLRNLPPEDLGTQELVRGEYPADPGHIAVTHQLANSLNVDVGSYITITGDLVAERYLISGIYAHSLFDNHLESAFEGLVFDAHPQYVAAYVDDSGQGGIEVTGTSAVSSQEVMDDILHLGNSVVIRSGERFDLIYDRQARALSAISVTVPWLIVTGFFVGTTVLFLGFVATQQRRLAEVRNLVSLGIKRRTLAYMHLAEIGVVSALSGVIGLALGLGISQVAVTVLSAVPGGTFMPPTLGAPVSAYVLGTLALIASVFIAAPLAAVVTGTTGQYHRRRFTILLVPLSVVLGALALYSTALIPLALPALPPLPKQVGIVALISLLIVTGFTLGVVLAGAVTSRMTLGARTHLIPRSRVGLVRLLALLIMFLSAGVLATLHTTVDTLAHEDVSFEDRFDVSVRSRLGTFKLTDYQVGVVQEWDSADRTLPLRLVDTDLSADAAFQPGPIYAVDQAEAERYFGAPVDLDSRLLVPTGTTDIPATVSFQYHDSDTLQVAELSVVEAHVPVALVSMTDVPGLEIDEIWVRLAPSAFTTLSQTYPDFEDQLGKDAPYIRPVITLSLGDHKHQPLNIGLLAMVVQSSICAVLSFVAFVRVPRAFARHEFEDRTLRAMGLGSRRRQTRRLFDVSVSGFAMLIGGSIIGIAASWLILSDAGLMNLPLRIPWAVIGANAGIMMLACMTFGAISARADVAHATNGAS